MWGLWDQNVGLNQLLDVTEMISFAAKWRGAKRTAFHSNFHDGHSDMVGESHELLDAADVVCHFNGKRFDTPHLNREYLEAGLTPPSPFKQIDLCQVVKRQFRFPSNKLAYVSKALGLPGKVEHGGHELWVKCLAGDPAAWATMKRYNIRDVTLLEPLHDRVMPWVTTAPNAALYTDGSLIGSEAMCPRCASTDLTKQGHAYTAVGRFQRYRCASCGSWSRDGKRIDGVSVQSIPTAQ